MEEKRNLKSPLGSLKISEEEDYGKISTNGSVKATVPFTVEQLAINGSLKGIKLTILEKGQINGGVIVEEAIDGADTAKLIINGSCNTPLLENFDKLVINGKILTKLILGIKKLRIAGVFEDIEEIEAENVRIDLAGECKIGTIKKAVNVEIGKPKEKSGTINLNIGGKNVVKNIHANFSDKEAFAEIDEIHATGTVELDHVKVNKVYAKELFVGEETEIGEFIEIVDDE